MLLNHPGFRSCEDCQKYIYNEDGTRNEREGIPTLRPPHSKTPCETCVKCAGEPAKSPAVGRQVGELSARNQKTLAIYQQIQGGAQIETDSVLNRHLGMIHAMVSGQDRRNSAGLSSFFRALTFKR